MPPSPPVLRGVHRRLALPPPPARPSLAVWRDLADADDDLAWALFALSRRVRDVADAPPTGTARWSHAADVRAAAANAPDIAADLLVLGARELSVTGVRGGKVAGACNRLAAWAAEQGFGEAAVQFAEAAVAIQPGNARRVYEAARLNRMYGNLDSAEVLYGRAICLARPGKHWWVYVRAHLGMGHVCKHRGQTDRAAAHYSTAARRARDKSGEKWLGAMIEHDLMVLAFECGDYELSHEHARKALDWMPRHNEQLPFLVHDYAFLLLQAHSPAAAMSLLKPLINKRLPSGSMVLIWSTYAWTAAALRNHDEFRHAERQVEALIGRYATHAATAYVNLGSGAHRLGLWTEAEQYAMRSAEIARSQSEAAISEEAEVLLARVSRREAPTDSEKRLTSDDVPRLTADLARGILAWRGPSWKGKGQASRTRLGKV